MGSVNNHLLTPQFYSRVATIIALEGVLDPGSLKSSLGESKKQRGLRTTMESFPKMHRGKKPFLVFSEKSHFLVSKAHLQVIVKYMSLIEGEKASLILSKINVYCLRGGKKLSRL